MRNTAIDALERQELIQKLIDCGYGQFVEQIVDNENEVFTRKGVGRLNKSGACRILGWKSSQLDAAFRECRRILDPDA